MNLDLHVQVGTRPCSKKGFLLFGCPKRRANGRTGGVTKWLVGISHVEIAIRHPKAPGCEEPDQ